MDPTRLDHSPFVAALRAELDSVRARFCSHGVLPEHCNEPHTDLPQPDPYAEPRPETVSEQPENDPSQSDDRTAGSPATDPDTTRENAVGGSEQ